MLLEKISDILYGTGGRTAEPDARFVVFTKYVNKSKAAGNECADALYDYLTKDHKELKGFSKDDVAVVTGQKCVPQGASLADYSGTDEERLPRILILTYQIAEAGVNLPGFNYVVNYHISEYPSSLEQRFGRIDRWNSNYLDQQIHACYLYDKSLRWDTNTFNFHRAVKTAIDGLLPLLPSRNVILSREILDKHISERDKWEKRLNEIERLLNDLGYTAYKLYFEQKHGDFEEEIKQLIDFFEDTMDIAEEWRKIFLGCSIVSKEEFTREAKRVIKILRDIGKDTFGRKMDLKWCKEVIEKFGNDIFYLPSNIEEGTGAKLEDHLKTITFEECLGSVREKMGEYLSRFYITCGDIVDYRKTEIKPLEEVLKKFEQELNQHFCDNFRQGCLKEVFPNYRISFRHENDIGREKDKIIEIRFEFYWDRIVYKIACHYAPEDTKIKFGTDAIEKVFGNRSENIAWRIKAQKDIFALNGASQNSFNLALIGKQYTLFALRQLPFFKMCNDFEMSLYENLFKKTGEPRYGRYNEDPFATACWEIREQAVNLGLMEEEPRNIEEIKDKYLSVTIDEGGVVTACAWYQLAAKLFIDHQELKKLNIYMLSCFCSNSAEVENPKWKPAKRENVKWPWPDKTDFSALQVQCGDFLTEYFLNCFRKEEPDSQ